MESTTLKESETKYGVELSMGKRFILIIRLEVGWMYYTSLYFSSLYFNVYYHCFFVDVGVTNHWTEKLEIEKKIWIVTCPDKLDNYRSY